MTVREGERLFGAPTIDSGWVLVALGFLAVGCDRKSESAPKLAFELNSPSHGQKGVTRTPTLAWTDAKDESGYRVEIATDPSFAAPVFEASVDADVNTVMVPDGVIGTGKRYFWRVRAVRGDRTETASNAPFVFTALGWSRTYTSAGTDSVLETLSLGSSGYLSIGMVQGTSGQGIDLWIAQLDAEGAVQRERSLGGTGYDFGMGIAEGIGGGYFAVGNTSSFGAGLQDAWVLKLSTEGEIEWQRTIGSPVENTVYAYLVQNDGYLLAGTNVTSGEYDGWLLKLDAEGQVVWSRSYARADVDFFSSLLPIEGGGALVGATALDSEIVLLEIDALGAIVWQKSYSRGGVGEYPYLASLRPRTGGGARVMAEMADSDIDIVLFDVDADGEVIVSRSYGGTDYDGTFPIPTLDTPDGGTVFTAVTQSFGAGSQDIWLVRLDTDGDILWQKTFGSSSDDTPEDLVMTPGGGFLVSGSSYGEFGMGGYNGWIFEVDEDGVVDLNTPESGFWSSDAIGTTAAMTISVGTPLYVSASYPVTTTDPTASFDDTHLLVEAQSGAVGAIAAPEILQVLPGGPEELRPTWSQVVDARGYGVFRSSDGLYFRRIASVSGESLTYSDGLSVEPLVSGETYYYRVIAFGDQGYGEFSAIRAATAP